MLPALPTPLFRVLKVLVVLSGLAVLALGAALLSAGDVTGARASGVRLERMQASPQWNGDRFVNELQRFDGSPGEMMAEFLAGGEEGRTPAVTPPQVKVDPALFDDPPASGLRVTWLGHSTFLVEIDGAIVLLDPVWSERASPFTWAGPERFLPPPLPLSSLPPLDAVLISHDHYDHLDAATVKLLSATEVPWVVPLGLGAHLESWGVGPDAIVELDWWEAHRVSDLVVTATPSRHFSGRSVIFSDQDATLWAGWAVAGPERRLFYSGDTALHPEFEAIGDRLGPFDVALLEVGAYDALWADVHLGPEQAVLAHRMVRGGLLIPAHWGLFDLALHGWTEPIERLLVAAERLEVEVAVPRPGASVDLGAVGELERWWPNLSWRSAEEAPAWSSGVDGLRRALRSDGVP